MAAQHPSWKWLQDVTDYEREIKCIAASHNPRTSLRNRLESAQMASQIHFNRTGKVFDITEWIIEKRQPLEERALEPRSTVIPSASSEEQRILPELPRLPVGLDNMPPSKSPPAMTSSNTPTATPSSDGTFSQESLANINQGRETPMIKTENLETIEGQSTVGTTIFTCPKCPQIFADKRCQWYHVNCGACGPHEDTSKVRRCLDCWTVWRRPADYENHMRTGACRMSPFTGKETRPLPGGSHYHIPIAPELSPGGPVSRTYSLFLRFDKPDHPSLDWSLILSPEGNSQESIVQIRVKSKIEAQRYLSSENFSPTSDDAHGHFQSIVKEYSKSFLLPSSSKGLMKLVGCLTAKSRGTMIEKIEQYSAGLTPQEILAKKDESNQWAFECLKVIGLSADLVAFIHRLKGRTMKTIDLRVIELVKWLDIIPDPKASVSEWIPSNLVRRKDLAHQTWWSWEILFLIRRDIRAYKVQLCQQCLDGLIEQASSSARLQSQGLFEAIMWRNRGSADISKQESDQGHMPSEKDGELNGETDYARGPDEVEEQNSLLIQDGDGGDNSDDASMQDFVEKEAHTPSEIGAGDEGYDSENVIMHIPMGREAQQLSQESNQLRFNHQVGRKPETGEIQQLEKEADELNFQPQAYSPDYIADPNVVHGTFHPLLSRSNSSGMQQSEAEPNGMEFQHQTNITSNMATPSLNTSTWDPLAIDMMAEEGNVSNSSEMQQIRQELGGMDSLNQTSMTGIVLDLTLNASDWDPRPTDSGADEGSRSTISGMQQGERGVGSIDSLNQASVEGNLLDPSLDPSTWDPIAFDEEIWNQDLYSV